MTTGPFSGLREVGALPASTFARMPLPTLLAGLFIGVPSDVIDTPLFGRPIEVRAIDYAILAVTALLIGLIFAVRVDDEATETRSVWGGAMSFLAVGCPVCNQAVVGLAAIVLLLHALSRRLTTYRLQACPLPA
jgi:hypothetical protein